MTTPWGIGWDAARPVRSAAEEAARGRMERDAELVKQCLSGDDGAWEDLVKTHTRLVYGACYRFMGRPEEARDITQEVFLRVFRSLHTFNPASGAFRTWLLRLTRNLLIDDYRRTRKDQVVDPLEDQLYSLEETQGWGARADASLNQREASEALQRALACLSPELREAVILRDLQGLEYREIGEALSIPEGTVKSRINRGRGELARRLRAMGIES